MASGKALGELLRVAWDIPSRLVYSGLVERSENWAMLNRLTPEWERVESGLPLEQYPALALVDTQPGAGNNRLPPEILPQIVLDHHQPIREAVTAVDYADIRPDIGATVTLLYQYLDAAGVEPDPILATAMFYGLKTDTRGLSRGASITDEVAYIQLLSHIDRRELIRVEQAGLPQAYYRAFSKGLDAARLYGQAIVAHLGSMSRPDFGAEMADVLIRMEGMHAVLCTGEYEETLYLSVRTQAMDQDAGLLIQQLVVPPGKAGGHGTMAGGQVPLENREQEHVASEITQRFLKAMGEAGDGTPLLSE
jgi:nanoRNase/pAp phosphatase (c-di-AMP/oligoRNAs hydrolase)